MCGFTGFLSKNCGDENTLTRMIATLHHRGPDNQGIWFDPDNGIGLAFARLSILDISAAGNQPMVSANGRYVIVFNGEIYNHLTIRTELELGNQALGWRGHSDTETLLAGFDTWGIENTIKRTVGMFAFAAWDKHTQTLTLGRDRIGEKPLYYGWQGNSFLFGSELKALKTHPDFKANINRNALASFMQYCYIPAPQSIYQGISKLVPGTLLMLKAGEHIEPSPIPYWSMLDIIHHGLQTPIIMSDKEALSELEKRLTEAVISQQISDVPIGVFLSGGIDSSAIAALMQTQSRCPISTFAIGFNDPNFNEAIHAKGVARHLGTHHTELYVSPEDAMSIIPRLSSLYDEPFADSSQIPTFLVSQLARRNVAVCLSGDAGDELFCGYNRYLWMRNILQAPFLIRKLIAGGIITLSPIWWNRIYELLEPLMPRTWQVRMPGDKAHKLAPVIALNSPHEIYKKLISIWANPEELILGNFKAIDLTDMWNSSFDSEPIESRMMVIDSLTYLPGDILCKLDRAAMGVSLETRTPFLDHRLVEWALNLPLNMKIRDGQSKWILRQLVYKYIPRELIDRPKMGFSVPIDNWLRGPLREWAEELLNESRLRNEGYLNPAPIRLKWEEHLSGKRNWQYHLWNVLTFQAWLAEQNDSK